MYPSSQNNLGIAFLSFQGCKNHRLEILSFWKSQKLQMKKRLKEEYQIENNNCMLHGIENNLWLTGLKGIKEYYKRLKEYYKLIYIIKIKENCIKNNNKEL